MDALLLIFMVGVIYFLPALVAWGRHHRNGLAIFVLNLLAGWTAIGWLVAIVWAFTNPARAEV
jgi:hypothetical protein